MASTAGLEHLRELISEHKTQQGIPAVLSGMVRANRARLLQAQQAPTNAPNGTSLDYAERLVRRH